MKVSQPKSAWGLRDDPLVAVATAETTAGVAVRPQEARSSTEAVPIWLVWVLWSADSSEIAPRLWVRPTY
jgi:hypothetical protein